MAGSSGLEAVLRISAKDEAGAAFSTLKAQIAGIDKQLESFDRLRNAVSKVAPATDPLIKAIGESTKALEAQKVAVAALSEGLDASEGAAAAAAGGQERSRQAILETSRAMVAQGVEAVRVAERIVQAKRRQSREGGGLRGRLAEAAPFLGPVILHEEVKGLEAGVSVQDEMARLRAAGATGAQIESARGDFREFSKTHSGVLESDYLAGFRDARVIAPGEMFEMARLGATYRAGLRNSGLSSSEEDVGNVLRIMDELGLKNMGQREDFLDNFLKSQQAFGSQISSETALAAYRNAKQSIYDWSPEFRNKYFPTLLQSAGQQGGTEMMTALNNYIGQHMQQSELRALVSAGFVNSSDLITNKGGDVRGLKPGARLFEADTFKSNIAQWAWDFHDSFMQRKGATEGGFDDLIARMPRNMAALVAFLNHNRGRIQRDAGTLDTPLGLKAADDATLANNPGAGLAALRDSIAQFSATVTSPAVAAAAPAMQGLAHAIQTMAASAGDFAKQHPQAAVAASAGGIAAVTGTGLWLTAKLWSGISKFLGLGGGAAGGAGGAAAGGSGAAAAGGGLSRIIGGVAGAASLPGLIDLLTDDNRTPGAKANDVAALAWGKSLIDKLLGPTPQSPSAGAPEHHWGPWHAGGTATGPVITDRQFIGRDPRSPQTGPYSYTPKGDEVTVSGEARVEHEITVRIEPSPLLTAIVDQARQQSETTVPLIGGGSGRMDSDAGPHRSSGIGHM